MKRGEGFIVAWVLLWAAPALARDLVELPAGRVYELKIDEDIERVWIALAAPQGGTLDGLTVGSTPVDVALGNRHESSLVRAFSATLRPPAQGQSPGIELELQMPQLSEPGAYDVQLQLTQGSDSQLLKLQIVIPEAQLRVLTSPLVERVIDWKGSLHISSTPLVLSETSRRSRLTGLAVQPIALGTLADKPVTGHVSFSVNSAQSSRPLSIPPGGTVTIPYGPEGDFPIGTVKGSVEVSAPQLKSPIAVNYEVHTRRAKSWILLLLFTGLVVGYLTRNWLASQVSLGEKRVELEALRLRLEDAHRRSPDAEYRKTVETALALLAQARDRDVKQVAAKVTEADQLFAQARETLEKRRTDESSRLDALDLLLANQWSVPTEAGGLLRKAREGLALSRKALQDDDVATASREREQHQRELESALLARLRGWKVSVEALVQRLSDAPLPLRKGDQDAVRSRLGQLQSAVEALPLDKVPVELRPLLDKTHEAHTLLASTAPRLRSQVSRVIQGVRDALASAGVPAAEVEQAAEQWAQAHGDSAEEELKWIADQSRKLDQALHDAVLRPLGAKPEAREQALLQERNYEELASLLARRKAAERASEIGGAPVFGWQPAAPQAALTFTEQGSPPPQSAILPHRLGPHIPQQAPSARDGYTRAFGALLRAKAARTLLSGIGILGVGYLLFEGTFVGTAQDLATVFIWGFTIDISVDALVDVMSKGVKKA